MPEGSLDIRFNAYLDGEMSDAERTDFEARLEVDESLRERFERWRRIEAGLVACFGGEQEAPDPLAFLDAGTPPMTKAGGGADGPGGEEPGPISPWYRRPVSMAAAAALVLAAGVVSYTTMTSGPARQPLRDSYVYAIVTSNFTPAVVCNTPEKFLDYTERTMDEPITADFNSAATLGVTLVGWDAFGAAYTAEGADELPRILMALGPGGEKIVVYFKERGQDTPQDDPANPPHVASKRLGRVMAYELSPLEKPVVLGLLGLDE